MWRTVEWTGKTFLCCNKVMHDTRGFIALICNGILLATYGIWVRLLQHTFSAYQQVTLRGIISFLLAVFLAIILRRKWFFEKKYNKHLVFYLFCFAASSILFTISVIQTSIALSVFGLYLGSIFSAFLLGKLFFQEKLSKSKLMSVLLALGALFFLTFPFSLHLLNAGFLVGIFGGIFDGIGNAFKKYFGRKIELPALIVFQFFATLLVAISLMFFTRESFSSLQLSLGNIFLLLIYGAIFLSVGYLSMYGFQHFNLNLGTIVISSELFWAPIFAFLLFHEMLTSYQIIGGFLIVLAIILPQIPSRTFKDLV